MASQLKRLAGFVLAASVAACGSNASKGSLFSASSGGSNDGFAFGGTGGTTSLGNGGAPAQSGGTTAEDTGGTPGIFITTPQGNDTCGGQAITVLFLIDRSGSMNCNLPPITASADCENMSPPAKVDMTAPSKWEVISSTISASLAQFVPTDPSIKVKVGLAYFSIDGVCGANSTPAVPVADADDAQFDLIRNSVAAQKPNGGTPIVGATILGYQYLYRALDVTSNAHIILITDGQDSCADYYASNPAIGPGDHVADLIMNQAPKALSVGIKTWVIGAPGSEPARSMLSNLAVSGGTRRSADCTPGTDADPTVGDCHYDMTTGDFQAALTMALTHIMAVVTCEAPS